MAIFPFEKYATQKAFASIFSIVGLLLTAIGLSKSSLTIFGMPLLSIGFILFVIGLFYLIEVTFRYGQFG